MDVCNDLDGFYTILHRLEHPFGLSAGNRCEPETQPTPNLLTRKHALPYSVDQDDMGLQLRDALIDVAVIPALFRRCSQFLTDCSISFGRHTLS
jgi:hypothetical protein